MNDQIKFGLGGIVIGASVVWFLTTSAVNSNNAGMMQLMGMHYGNQRMMSNSNIIDAHFIEQMIPHHEDAITMAELALIQSTRPEVKTLAQNIISSQTKEIDQMNSWYKEWFGRGVPTGTEVMQHHGMGNSARMHMGMMGDESDMSRLEQAEDFDRVFVEEMIPHHQMAVMMASMLKNGTQRSEMKQLADDIITAQTIEIDQMRVWLNEWEN